MKSYRKELWINFPQRRGYLNITSEVQQAITASGIQEGLVLVNAMHCPELVTPLPPTMPMSDD